MFATNICFIGLYVRKRGIQFFECGDNFIACDKRINTLVGEDKMIKAEFLFNVLVKGWKKEEAKELLNMRIEKLKEDKNLLRETIQIIKKPLSYYDSHPENLRIQEEEKKAEKKRTDEELIPISVYRKDFIVKMDFENLQDYFWAIVRHSPDYAEILEADGWDDDKVLELNQFVGVVLDGQRKIVTENSIMLGIIKKRCPDVLERKPKVEEPKRKEEAKKVDKKPLKKNGKKKNKS